MPDNDKDFSHYHEDSAALRRLKAMVAPKPKVTWLDKVTVRLVRWALTAALVFGVYTETGIWTAISMTLIFVAIEIICLIPRWEP